MTCVTLSPPRSPAGLFTVKRSWDVEIESKRRMYRKACNAKCFPTENALLTELQDFSSYRQQLFLSSGFLGSPGLRSHFVTQTKFTAADKLFT